jgi:hypothetical protein
MTFWRNQRVVFLNGAAANARMDLRCHLITSRYLKLSNQWQVI